MASWTTSLSILLSAAPYMPPANADAFLAALLGTRGWQRMKFFPRRDRSGFMVNRGGFINRRRYYEVPSLQRIDVVRGGPPEISSTA